MKIYYKFILILLVTVVLQSCSITKQYERPDIETADTYRLNDRDEDSTSIAAIPWREMFTDTILQGYIERSIIGNYDMLIAVQSIERAQALLEQANAGNIPVISGQAGYTGSHPSKYSTGGLFATGFSNQYNLGLNLSWEADIWGKIRSMKDAAKAQYLQTEVAKNAVQTGLVSSVATIYYQLLALDAQREIANKTISLRKESLATTQALKDAGQLTAAAVKQTEALIYEAELVLLVLDKAVTQLENALSVLMAEAPHAIERSSLENQEIISELSMGVPAMLLENRPDVMIAEYSLINAFQLENVAKASLYPTLTLSASAGLNAIDHNPFSASGLFGSVGAGLLAPILNRKQLRTQHKVSRINKEIALLNFRKVLLSASQEVSDILADYQTANQVMSVQEKQVEALVLATEYSQELLNYGMANYLEVLTAQQQSLGAQLGLVETKVQRLTAVVELYRALGGGWK